MSSGLAPVKKFLKEPRSLDHQTRSMLLIDASCRSTAVLFDVSIKGG